MKLRDHPAVTTEEALPALLRQRFDLFLRFACREVIGQRQYVPNWHIDAIHYQLERLLNDENRQLIVTVPPRHLKSTIISVAWVAWMLGRFPQTRFTCISYAYDLSEKHARDCLTIMDSAWYRNAFPNLRLTKRSVLDFETNAGGGRLSTSVGGVLTGRGADWIIMDDLMKGDDALSESARNAVGEWFSNTLRQRADDERTRYILVMQRLHEDDLAGRLKLQGGWYELKLPAIATEDQRIPLIGGRYHQRREGHAILPSRQSLSYLNQRKAEDPYTWAAQHQQDPIARQGAFVQLDWFGRYDEIPKSGLTFQSWDTAIKVTVRSDWSVCITAILYQGRLYILDVYRKRIEFGQLYKDVCRLYGHFRVNRLLIEDAGSGQQLLQELRRELDQRGIYAIPVKPAESKIHRFEKIASLIEAGMVVLPRTAPWMADFLSEVTQFPGGRHDDQADALAQMLNNLPRAAACNDVDDDAYPESVEQEPYDQDAEEYNQPYDDDPWAGDFE